MIRISALPVLVRRLLVISLGGAVFAWLSLEDNDVFLPALAGWSTSFLVALRWLMREPRQVSRLTLAAGGLLLGAAVGIGAALAAALLMLIKNGLHGHVFPDFPFGVILGILERGASCSLAGTLFGLGLSLAWISYTASNRTES